MPRTRSIRLRESSPVPRSVGLDANLQARLLAATAHLPFEVFRLTRTGLGTCGVVGLIDLGEVQVEIIPKAGLIGNVDEGKATTAFLLDLLRFTGLAARSSTSYGKVAKTTTPLLEVLARAFAELLHEKLWDGPPRRYYEIVERSPVLRGRLEMAELAQRSVVLDGRLPVRYAPLHHDHRLSQAIAATAALVAQKTSSSRTWALLEHCLSHLEGVDAPPLTQELVSGVRLARSELHWEGVLDFARLLAAGHAPAPTSGGGDAGFTLLFPLHDLFEGVLRRVFPAILEGTGLGLLPSKRGGFLLRSMATQQPALALRPDFLFTRSANESAAFVGDAKWKTLEQRPGFGVQEADAYQIATYMMRRDLRLGLLFYPLVPWMVDSGATRWTHRFSVEGRDGACVALLGVDIASLVSRDAERKGMAVADLRTILTDLVAHHATL